MKLLRKLLLTEIQKLFQGNSPAQMFDKVRNTPLRSKECNKSLKMQSMIQMMHMDFIVSSCTVKDIVKIGKDM